MSYPTDTKSILVRERVLAVLHGIIAGADFFFTPGVVYDNYKNWIEREAFPSYEVYFGAGGNWTMYAGLMGEETFTLAVRGQVKDDDPASAVRKALRDIRKAIMDDAAATSLDGNALKVSIGSTTTDDGQESSLGSAWFIQEFAITISGEIEDL